MIKRMTFPQIIAIMHGSMSYEDSYTCRIQALGLLKANTLHSGILTHTISTYLGKFSCIAITH